MSQFASITVERLNLRAGQDARSPVLEQVHKGMLLEILETPDSERVKVRVCESGMVGYILATFLEMTETQPGFSAQSAIGFDVEVSTHALRIRSGPGMQYRRIGAVREGTVLRVIEVHDAWLKVIYGDREGYVSAKYTREVVPVAPGGAKVSGANTSTEPERFIPAENLSEHEQIVVRIWNRYGGWLQKLSERTGIPVARLVAVTATEDRPSPDSSHPMEIRFEVHLFHQYYGKFNAEQFHRHFAFNGWQSHRWRADDDDAWLNVHESQAQEWRALTYARSLDDTTALMSTAMGPAQVMGYHYGNAGYENVQVMFDTFIQQLPVPLFPRLLEGSRLNSTLVSSLRDGDYHTFTSLYHGPGNAERFGAWLQQFSTTFNRLILTARPRGASLPDDVRPPVSTDMISDVPLTVTVPFTKTQLNVRRTPDMRSPIIQVLPPETPLNVLEPLKQALKKTYAPPKSNQWLHVRTDTGHQGFVAAWWTAPDSMLTGEGFEAHLNNLKERNIPSVYQTLWSNQKYLGLPDPFTTLPVKIRTEDVLTHMQVNGFGPNTFALRYWQDWYDRLCGVHSGYDFIVDSGTPLLAVSDGVIMRNWHFIANQADKTLALWCFLPPEYRDSKGRRMMSNVIVGYAHMSENALHDHLTVVRAGEVIGLSGTPGMSGTNDHLHIEVHLLQGDENLPRYRQRNGYLLTEYHRPQPLDNNTPWNPLLFFSPRLIQYMLHQGKTIGYMGKQPEYPSRTMLKKSGIYHLPDLNPFTIAYFQYGGRIVWNNRGSTWSSGMIPSEKLAERLKTFKPFQPYEGWFLPV